MNIVCHTPFSSIGEMPTILSRLRSLGDFRGIFERPRGVKSRLAFDRQRGPVSKTIDLELTEDVLGGVDCAPLGGGEPQGYKLKIGMDEV